MAFSHQNGKKRMYCLFTRKTTHRQCLGNYRPVRLLPICGKIPERLIFNEIFPPFIKNSLISRNQSGFKPGDYFVNQILSITHEIYKSFDDWFDVRSVFLDISKVFDKYGMKVLN